jgi:importin-5
MKDPNWKYRQAGLYAISFCAEGCKTFLSKHLDKVLEFALPALKDPHPRVRWTACNCIGQLCTDFSPKIQYTYTKEILFPVIAAMDDENGRVQAHAVAVIVNFCEYINDSLLSPYLNPLLQKMSELLTRSHLLVIENTLIAISSVADAVKEHFAPVRHIFTPQYHYSLQSKSH